MNRLKIALAGVGGFGAVHVAAAETLAQEGLVEITACAETIESTPAIEALRAQGVRHYRDYYEMLAAESGLDLVSIATPIACHAPMAMAAFERGLHVFLEKPPAVRIQDFRAMLDLQQRKGCYCTVGFHDVARPAVIALKRRLCEGAIGAVRAVHAEARWSRPDRYYARNAWAGRTCVEGQFALDGPMNNSCAHVLNMAAYLTGPDLHEFARPRFVQGELYRANDIEGEDTNCLRAIMDTEAEVCLHLTQCASQSFPRTWTVIGEEGAALLHEQDGVILPNERIEMTEPERPTLTALRRLAEVIIESDEPLIMPLAEAEGFVLMSNGAYESSGEIHRIPREYVRRVPHGDSTATVIVDIDSFIIEAAATGRLLSEYEVPWAVPTPLVDVTCLTQFPVRWRG